ncbi:MAG: FRG domain-containing protein, partial [Cyanobacteria bacterium P01_A01_bin.40]
RNANWPLISSAARPMKYNPLKDIAQLFEPRMHKFDYWKKASKGQKNQALLSMASYTLTARFLSLASELNFPLKSDFMPDEEWTLHNQFAEYSGGSTTIEAYWYDSLPSFLSIEDLALAQHHGIPTFLLDWTENPIIALYFAAANSKYEQEKHDICVWALSASKLNKVSSSIGIGTNSGKISLLRPQKSNNRFLSSQSGVFTHLKGVGQQWAQTGECPTIDSILEDYTLDKAILKMKEWNHDSQSQQNYTNGLTNLLSTEQNFLKKIILKKEHIEELRTLLMREGITKAHLMPSLDNVAKTVISFYRE